MACFIAPMILAIVTTALQKASKGLAEKLKLWILNALLWGGTTLLILEHAWHGEVVPWPPFLTAMESPADVSIMFHEIATVGILMCIGVLAAWGAIVAISYYMPILTLKAERLKKAPLPKPQL